ncbi:Protein unc-93 homolog A,UNC93-like protein [Mytilus coruscus]|uniref:Protein unc-93 homolog A,UNC93-like protein n=1 Tax=Mytilus coruscus TaxID=42192 RepID=A0A6J8CQV3_MYTCO|nr:Protein unc-93 homolog A,UNC93-like protein [Mytilus coruscus]
MGTDKKKEVDKKTTEEDIPLTKCQILRNVFVVSLGFVFLFTSFQSLQNLQSTLNKEEGIGTGGLSIIYGALVISCMFVPSFVINHIGYKWTIAASMICYILYMAANFHAVWGLIVPASIIIGLGAAPLWSAKSTYLTRTAVWYAKLTGSTENDVINRFFGFFFMAFHTSKIWGNLISSEVFSKPVDANFTPTADELAQCGANYDPGKEVNNTNLERPDIAKVYTVCGIYLASGTIGFLIIVFLLQNIPVHNENEKEKGKFSFHLLIETFKHFLKSPTQKMLVILTMYIGVEQAFLHGDFTQSYVGCTIGIWNLGYVMICNGVVAAICSFSFGRLVEYIGRIPCFAFAFFVHGGTQIALLLWQPQRNQTYIFYIVAGLWGIGDAVIQTQMNALYGYLFTNNIEAAFANYGLWESVGFIITFACSNFLIAYVKLYICLGFLSVGMMLYVVVEVYDRRNKKTSFELN